MPSCERVTKSYDISKHRVELKLLLQAGTSAVYQEHDGQSACRRLRPDAGSWRFEPG